MIIKKLKYKSRYKLAAIMVLFASSFLVSCAKDEASSNVSSDLQPYFLRFDTEAVSRGRVINVMDSSLIAGLVVNLPPSVIGQCQHNSAKPSEIKISLRDWQTFSDLQKEYVVFHELGHCILHRSHTDQRDSNGNCVSIMESGGGTCRKIYTAANRAAFLDELFNN